MELKKQNSNSSNKINIVDETQTKNIFESLTEGWDKDYKQDETHPYIKEIRLVVIGNVDSGKSTLVGCLSKGIKDDGRGYARKFVFNFQHESESGRTSSIAEEIIGFKDGKIIQSGRLADKKNVSWKEIATHSDHVITFLDLCGHEKYLKTTMYGVSALLPHYAVILIGTNMGVQRMTKEHLGIVYSLGIPFFIVFTKIDIAPKEVKEKTINFFTSILKTGLQKTVFNVKSTQDAIFASKGIYGGTLVPIFQVSTVTGDGLEDLKTFLSKLSTEYPKMNDYTILKTPKDKTEMLLDHAFNTKVGCIFAGVIVSGKIENNQKLLIGPTNEGEFKLVQVKEIQFLRVTVDELCCGNSCSVKLKSLDKNFELNTNNFKKGMVLLETDYKLQPTLEFEVEALIVHHSSTIKVGYQSVVHCHVIRQTCTVVSMDKEFLRSGDKGIIRFRFMKKPEIMHEGDTILFREGRTRGKGKIIKIFPIDIDALNKEKQNKKNVNKKAQVKKEEEEEKNNQQPINNYNEENNYNPEENLNEKEKNIDLNMNMNINEKNEINNNNIDNNNNKNDLELLDDKNLEKENDKNINIEINTNNNNINIENNLDKNNIYNNYRITDDKYDKKKKLEKIKKNLNINNISNLNNNNNNNSYLTDIDKSMNTLNENSGKQKNQIGHWLCQYCSNMNREDFTYCKICRRNKEGKILRINTQLLRINQKMKKLPNNKSGIKGNNNIRKNNIPKTKKILNNSNRINNKIGIKKLKRNTLIGFSSSKNFNIENYENFIGNQNQKINNDYNNIDIVKKEYSFTKPSFNDRKYKIY